jgi:hypothetical protein
MKKLIIPCLLIFGFYQTYGQTSDHYDNSGKIWSVVAVVCLVILGIATMLFILERRIKKMEDKLN